MQTFETLHKDGCRYLVLNLTSVFQMSDGITSLLKFAHEYFSAGDGKLAIVSPLNSVRQALDHADITNLIPTYMTVYDSLHRRQAIMNKPAPGTNASSGPAMQSSDADIPPPGTEQTVDEMVGMIE